MDIPKRLFISHPSGKMTGIPVITTSMMCNPICTERAKDKSSVCFKCYAARGLKMYKSARDKYADNSEILSSHILSGNEIPMMNCHIARFESHGDLINPKHAENYINIANANKWCTFAIWTKNAIFMDAAIRKLGKPDNMICVFSSNKVNEIDKAYVNFDWIDHVFTVYDRKYISDNNIEINCGAKSCITCKKCYTIGNDEFFISERLK